MRKIKVFLVEDEVIIRNGIKKNIEWEKEGYEFVGEASDGELAYPMILKEKPDILITDIKMPFMDGLELSSLVRKELPDIKILILSGYDEFEYAKEAIKIGVTEYILKPVSSAKLLEILQGVAKMIEQEWEEKEFLKRYLEDMKENTEHEKMKFFGRLVRGEVSATEMIASGKNYGLDTSASCYNIILFKILSTVENCIESQNLAVVCEKIENAVREINGVSVFQRGVDGWAFLVSSEPEESEKKKEEVIRTLKETMKQWKEIEYFGGAGNTVTRISALGTAFREADKAFAMRFSQEPNQIMKNEKIAQREHEGIKTRGFTEIGQSREMVEKFLNNGTVEEIDSFVEVYMAKFQTGELKSLLMRQYIIMDIHIVIMSFCEKMSMEDEELQKRANELKDAMQNLTSTREICKYITNLLKRAIDLRDMVSGRRYSDIITTAQEMIQKNYMSEDISLNTVAVSVGMSPSYFSSIFGKEVGKTFVEYLTETRMEKAKEYLMCSSMKTSEIGYEVGYKDPHYFSYIFKKTQGCSPKEYRARRKES